jgi:hypothetical protein
VTNGGDDFFRLERLVLSLEANLYVFYGLAKNMLLANRKFPTLAPFPARYRPAGETADQPALARRCP